MERLWMGNRDSRGRFIKGHKTNMKDFTKEAAKKSVQEEMSYLVQMLVDKPVREIRDMNLEDESLLTNVIVKKALKGHSDDMRWAVEMVAGKATQQVEADLGDKTKQIFELAYKK